MPNMEELEKWYCARPLEDKPRCLRAAALKVLDKYVEDFYNKGGAEDEINSVIDIICSLMSSADSEWWLKYYKQGRCVGYLNLFLGRAEKQPNRDWNETYLLCGRLGELIDPTLSRKRWFDCTDKEPNCSEKYFGHIINMATTRNTNLKKKYGITFEDYTQMLTEQSSGCAICGLGLVEGKKLFPVDHDHITGKVRGILCFKCNIALGLLKDNPNYIEYWAPKACIYLRSREIVESIFKKNFNIDDV